MPALADRLVAASRLPVPEHGPGDARRVADEILRGPAYREPAKPWLERVQDAVLELVGRLLSEIVEGATGSPLGWLVVAGVVALLVVLAVRFGRGVTRDPGRDVEAVVLPRRAAADWREEAAAREREGDWRAAVRCRYRALVADLAERGIVDEVPGRTAGEYRREVAEGVPEAAVAFDGASTLFELAWYGHAETGPEEAARFRALEDRVLSA